MNLPGLDRDTGVITRPGSAIDTEGNPTQVLTPVLTVAGTWGSPSYRDLARAAQAGQVIDAVFATPAADIRIGDLVETRGKTYSVVTVADTRFHIRVGLRLFE